MEESGIGSFFQRKEDNSQDPDMQPRIYRSRRQGGYLIRVVTPVPGSLPEEHVWFEHDESTSELNITEQEETQ